MYRIRVTHPANASFRLRIRLNSQDVQYASNNVLEDMLGTQESERYQNVMGFSKPLVAYFIPLEVQYVYVPVQNGK